MFIGLKLAGVISWPWIWVLAPMWIPLGIWVISVLVMVIARKKKKKGERRLKARILVDVPDKGCRECRFKEKKGLMSTCIVTGDNVTRNVVDERRPATCPMVPLEKTGTIEPGDVALRTYNALRRAGYSTWSEVAEATEMELKRIRGLGAKGLREIQEKLKS